MTDRADEIARKIVAELIDRNDRSVGAVGWLGIQIASAIRSAEPQWQPIETAPKDGRGIWLLSREHFVEDQWDKDADGKPIIHRHEPRCHVGHWDPEGDSWVDENGSLDGDAYTLAVTGVWISGSGWFQPNEVTHWMPLPASPAPPEAISGKEG